MAKEFFTTGTSGLNLYAVLYDSDAELWDTVDKQFNTPDSADWTDYDFPLTETGSAGVYTADFPTDVSGPGVYPYEVRTRAGGSPAVSDAIYAAGTVNWTGTFEDQGGTYLISLTEFIAMNGDADASVGMDNQILAIIPAIDQWINTYLGFTVIEQTLTEVYDGTGNTFLRLRHPHVSDIDSVTFDYQGPFPTTIDGNNFIVNARTGMISKKRSSSTIVPAFEQGEQNIQVVYTAGWDSASVPQDIKLAASMLISATIESLEEDHLLSGETWDQHSVSFGALIPLIDKLSANAKQILDRYKPVKFIF